MNYVCSTTSLGEAGAVPEAPAPETHAEPKPRSFADFCAVLISSLITSILALALEGAKLIRTVFSATHHTESLPRSALSPSPLSMYLDKVTTRMDMYDEPDTNVTTIELEAPGLSKDAVDIALYEGQLTISFDSPVDQNVPLGRFYHRRERQQGRLGRTIKLPAGTKVRHATNQLCPTADDT